MPGRKRDMSLLLKEGEPRVEVSTRQMDMHEDGVAPLQKFSIPAIEPLDIGFVVQLVRCNTIDNGNFINNLAGRWHDALVDG